MMQCCVPSLPPSVEGRGEVGEGETGGDDQASRSTLGGGHRSEPKF